MSFQTPITSEKAPKAIGCYSPGLCLNGLVLFSGQLPINPETGKIEAEDAAGQTRQSMDNIAALLEAADLTYADVVRTTIFLADINDFAAVNAVYGEYVKEPYPVRSCFQVAALPMGAKVEIEVTCARGTIATEACECCK
ncbi:MAG: Rid family detoxifying hydrolase [Lachnospiraceae bacterium]